MSVQSLGITALAFCWFAGCSSVYTAYSSEGAPQKASAASINGVVLVNDDNSHIWILSVDGERKGVPSHGRYQLQPGRHTVRVAYAWSQGYVTWTGNSLADYSFNVNAGTALRVVCQHTEDTRYKGTWKFWIEDAAKGEIVTTEDSGPILVREATGERREPYYRRFSHSSRGLGM